jgi:hypothetical protein
MKEEKKSNLTTIMIGEKKGEKQKLGWIKRTLRNPYRGFKTAGTKFSTNTHQTC